nr:hypothetical protein [Angustibacter aerolatus]
MASSASAVVARPGGVPGVGLGARGRGAVGGARRGAGARRRGRLDDGAGPVGRAAGVRPDAAAGVPDGSGAVRRAQLRAGRAWRAGTGWSGSPRSICCWPTWR